MSERLDQAGEQWLSMAQTTALAGVSVSTILRYERAGRIQSRRTPGGHRRFRRSDVEGLLTHRGRAADNSEQYSVSPAPGSGRAREQRAAGPTRGLTTSAPAAAPPSRGGRGGHSTGPS